MAMPRMLTKNAYGALLFLYKKSFFSYSLVCLCLDSGEAKTTPENALPWKKITFSLFHFFTNKKFSHFC